MTDSAAIVIGICAAVPPTIIALATLIQQIRTHSAFNSKMDAAIAAAKTASFAEGQKKEKDDQAIAVSAVNASKVQAAETKQATTPPS